MIITDIFPGKVWKFGCTLGGQIIQFTLDSVEKICEAATWVGFFPEDAPISVTDLIQQVWDKIKVGWQKLKDFVGFVFNWGDIKDTKNTISTLLTASIGAASDKVGDLERSVDGFFDGLEKKIDEFGSVGPKKITANQADKASDSESSNSTGASWAQERLKNGGATTSTEVEEGKVIHYAWTFRLLTLLVVNPDQEAVETWSSVFQPAFDKLEKDVTNVSADIAKLFKKDGAISGDDVIDASKGVLKVALSTLRGLVTSILRLVQKLCGDMIKLGNKPIKIPIFSALWRKISGSDLTIFDAINHRHPDHNHG